MELPELGIRVVSDASGRIDLGSLPAGQHELTAERAGYEAIVGELNVPGNADFVILLSRAVGEDLLGPGQIVGRVTQEGSTQGLSDVEITVPGSTVPGTVSDRRGRFSLTNVEPGLTQIRFARLGYAPRTATLIVQPGRTAELSASMSTQPIELEAIEVSVRPLHLERNGFYRRARAGWGTQLDRQALDRIRPPRTSDLIARIPGVRLTWLPLGQGVVASSSRVTSFTQGPCPLAVWIDGMPMHPEDLNYIEPEDLAAFEIYQGASTPIRYRNNPCGAVLIWTKR